jgi:transcriptional regulator with XRE-family HTH domain
MASKIFATSELKKYRESKGYTQLEMCSLLGIEMEKDVALSTYQKWEQGSLYLTPDSALMLSRFTRIQLKDLVAHK